MTDPSKPLATPTYRLDVTDELRVLREQDRTRVALDAELKTRVEMLEAHHRVSDSRRTLLWVGVVSAILTAVGSVLAVIAVLP